VNKDTFSFRWGIHLLDGGSTQIPNFILDNYTAAGASRAEFLVIIHLARFQFESERGECRPSVATVAQAMGYSERGLQKVLAKMTMPVKKNGVQVRPALLVKRYRPGRSTVYDFTPFSKRVLEVAFINSEGGVNYSSGVNPSSGVGVNPSSPEEENKRRRIDNDDNNSNHRAETFAAIIELFESEIGAVTPGTRDKLQRWFERYPSIERWRVAFDGVIGSGVRRLDYLTTCLENVGKPHYARPGR